MITVTSENDREVLFSNEDKIYEGIPVEFWKGKWFLETKKIRELAKEYHDKNQTFVGGVQNFCATNKNDAINEYLEITKNILEE